MAGDSEADVGVTAVKPERIVRVGTAGGILTLWGLQTTDEACWFSPERDELVLADVLGTRDQDLLTMLRGPSHWIAGWDAAPALLDRYPRAQLTPITVHPAFHDRACAAVRSRLGDDPQDHWFVGRDSASRGHRESADACRCKSVRPLSTTATARLRHGENGREQRGAP